MGGLGGGRCLGDCYFFFLGVGGCIFIFHLKNRLNLGTLFYHYDNRLTL